MAKKMSKKAKKKKIQMYEDALEELTMRQHVLRMKREVIANKLDKLETENIDAIIKEDEKTELVLVKQINALRSNVEFYDKEDAKLAESIKQYSAIVEQYKGYSGSRFERGMNLVTSTAQMASVFIGLYQTGKAVNNALAKDVDGAMENKTTAQFGRSLIQKFFGTLGRKR